MYLHDTQMIYQNDLFVLSRIIIAQLLAYIRPYGLILDYQPDMVSTQEPPELLAYLFPSCYEFSGTFLNMQFAYI